MYSNYGEPDYAAAVGLITHLSNEELRELINEESKCEDLVKDVKQLKDLETEKEMILASSRSLAEYNLAKEPLLEEGKDRLQQATAKGEALCHSVESKVAEIKQLSQNTSLDTILALLQTAAAESEEESETVAEKFLKGEMELEDFMEQFVSWRKTMHLRRVKADKMAELMANKATPSALQPPASGYPVGHHFTSPPYFPLPNEVSNPPYPLAATPPYRFPMNMPMPGMYGANVH